MKTDSELHSLLKPNPQLKATRENKTTQSAHCRAGAAGGLPFSPAFNCQGQTARNRGTVGPPAPPPAKIQPVIYGGKVALYIFRFNVNLSLEFTPSPGETGVLPALELSANEQKVYDALDRKERSIDEVIRKNSLPASAVNVALLSREMKRVM